MSASHLFPWQQTLANGCGAGSCCLCWWGWPSISSRRPGASSPSEPDQRGAAERAYRRRDGRPWRGHARRRIDCRLARLRRCGALRRGCRAQRHPAGADCDGGPGCGLGLAWSTARWSCSAAAALRGTLSMMGVARGLMCSTPARSDSIANVMPTRSGARLDHAPLLGDVPAPVLVALLIVAWRCCCSPRRAWAARHAIGGNEETARLAGVPSTASSCSPTA